VRQNQPLKIVGDARSGEHVPFKQFKIANALSLYFLSSSKEISLVGSWDRRAWLELIKVILVYRLYRITDINLQLLLLLYRLSDIRIRLDSRNKTHRRHAILRVYKVGKDGIG
jgi:hypothetical protein